MLQSHCCDSTLSLEVSLGRRFCIAEDCQTLVQNSRCRFRQEELPNADPVLNQQLAKTPVDGNVDTPVIKLREKL